MLGLEVATSESSTTIALEAGFVQTMVSTVDSNTGDGVLCRAVGVSLGRLTLDDEPCIWPSTPVVAGDEVVIRVVNVEEAIEPEADEPLDAPTRQSVDAAQGGVALEVFRNDEWLCTVGPGERGMGASVSLTTESASAPIRVGPLLRLRAHGYADFTEGWHVNEDLAIGDEIRLRAIQLE